VNTLDDCRNRPATILRKIQDLVTENDAEIKLLDESVDGEFDEIIHYNLTRNLTEEIREDKIQPQDKLLSFVSVEGHK
jgi:hypothetical protein